MSFKTKIVFLLILVFGLQMNSNGQTITFNILKKMIASRQYKDSLLNSFKFIKKSHIPAAVYGVESESFENHDTSEIVEIAYKDSSVVVAFLTKDLSLLQRIVSNGQIEGFVRTSGITTNPNASAYIKGKWGLVFFNNGQGKRKSSASLSKNYQAFKTSLK